MVVAALNRMDGRQYAIKKIALAGHSPAAYARVLREVATLSRLQHPHVVRYFQVSPPINEGVAAQVSALLPGEFA